MNCIGIKFVGETFINEMIIHAHASTLAHIIIVNKCEIRVKSTTDYLLRKNFASVNFLPIDLSVIISANCCIISSLEVGPLSLSSTSISPLAKMLPQLIVNGLHVAVT